MRMHTTNGAVLNLYRLNVERLRQLLAALPADALVEIGPEPGYIRITEEVPGSVFRRMTHIMDLDGEALLRRDEDGS